MTAPTVWWLMTFALVALELITGTIYALLVAIGFAVGALAAHLGAAMPTQIVCAAVACVAFVGGWYLRSSRHPKARLADMQIDVGEQVTQTTAEPHIERDAEPLLLSIDDAGWQQALHRFLEDVLAAATMAGAGAARCSCCRDCTRRARPTGCAGSCWHTRPR